MKKISEILREKREEQKFSLDEVEKKIKIKKNFLQAIEEGKLHTLPSESYAQGFVKNYADFLGVPASQAVPLFRREYEAEEIDVVPHFTKSQKNIKKRDLFSYKSLFIAAACLIVVTYIVFQFKSLFFGPLLLVNTPQDGQSVTSNVIQVKGTTDPYANIYVNGNQVYVDLSGSFAKSLYLYSGKQTVTVIAKDRNGKQTEKDITVNVNSESTR